VFRRSFKTKYLPAPSLSFAYTNSSEVTVEHRPISQFDLTVNDVCRECNQGWLNALENEAEPLLDRLLGRSEARQLTDSESRLLGFWVFVRALLITHVSPDGRAPIAFFRFAERWRTTPPGTYVQVGRSTHRVWEAGSHQSLRLQPGHHYLGYVAFGIESLVFITSFSDGSQDAMNLSLDTSAQPRRWFPGALSWLVPQIPNPADTVVMSGRQAQIVGVALALRAGVSRPVDQFGRALSPKTVIPTAFHRELHWPRVPSTPQSWLTYPDSRLISEKGDK
jgi:hypothetical protein